MKLQTSTVSLFFAVLGLFGLSGCFFQTAPVYTETAHTSKARHKATMRTYTVRGKRYKPTYVSVNDTMRGVSSWYGPNFHGKQTSNGEWYNMHAMTAAHKTWPMDTMVRVENLKNGKSVVVRINDRGPFVSGRVIDCSYAAGKQIGLDTLGIAPVRLTVLGFAGKVYRPPVQTQNTVVATRPVPTVKLSNFGIQVGAFSRHEGAISYRDKYQKIAGANLHVVIKNAIEGRDSLYRVRIMGFSSEDEARDFMSSNGIQGGIIVRP